jgi:hypothetical protein
MDRQRLIFSLLKARRWQGGCEIDLREALEDKIFEDVYPLHVRQEQESLADHWIRRPYYKLTQPTRAIRDYFGEKVWLIIFFLFLIIGPTVAPLFCKKKKKRAGSSGQSDD